MTFSELIEAIGVVSLLLKKALQSYVTLVVLDAL
jgi:hypothetical protein